MSIFVGRALKLSSYLSSGDKAIFIFIKAAPELDSNPGLLSYKAPTLTTLLYCFFIFVVPTHLVSH